MKEHISDLSSLTKGELRIIRNYRAMERIAQQTLEGISEDFAGSLPALERQELSDVINIEKGT